MGDEYVSAENQVNLFGWLSKYQHVERLGHEEVTGLIDEPVYVQEKIDGANLTVAFVNEHFLICSRSQVVSIDGKPARGFNGAVEYVLSHPMIPGIVRNGYVLRGEWLVRHSLNYKAENMGKFYVFDVQMPVVYQSDKNCVWLKYLSPDEYEPMLDKLGICYIPAFAKGQFTLTQLTGMSQRTSLYGENDLMAEGVVIKRTNFRNKWDRVVWGKIVSREFAEKKALHTHVTKFDAPEVRFAGLCVTQELIYKTIAKIADSKNRPANVTDMHELIGRVWYDAFQEELWDFVKDQRIKQFNFDEARRLVIAKTRDIALAHFNGLPQGFGLKEDLSANGQDQEIAETGPA